MGRLLRGEAEIPMSEKGSKEKLEAKPESFAPDWPTSTYSCAASNPRAAQ
jgi:hypothetical protein